MNQEEREKISGAVDLIIEVLALNKIPVGVGITACWGLVMRTMELNGATVEQIRNIENQIEIFSKDKDP